MSVRDAKRPLAGMAIPAGRMEVVLGTRPDGRRAASIPLPYKRLSSLHLADLGVILDLIEDLQKAHDYVAGSAVSDLERCAAEEALDDDEMAYMCCGTVPCPWAAGRAA